MIWDIWLGMFGLVDFVWYDDDLKYEYRIKETNPNNIYQSKPTKPNLPNQTYQTKPIKQNLSNKTYQTKPTKPNLPNQTYKPKISKGKSSNLPSAQAC